MPDDIARLDATAQAQLVRDGEVTALELVDAAIERIEALDPKVNAVVHRRFDAARAEVADLPDGPFTGVPITVKDLWPTIADEPWHQGVRALKDAGYVHPTDSNLVKRYRQAGFILIGKTNTAELGLSATTEPLSEGPTRNPWNLDHGAGGSSGGAAASVAAGMTSVANASDGGGSIRIPAAHNGLVGLKPSRGRLSMGPLQEEWNTSVQHVVCHTMRDAANILDATATPFLTDGVVAPRPQHSFAAYLDGAKTSLRIGFTTESRPGIVTHPDLAAAVHEIAALLERLGHRVQQASPSALHDPAASGSMGVMSAVGTRARLGAIAEMIGRPLVEGDVEPGTWTLAQMSEGITGVQVVEAQADQHRLRNTMLSWWEDGWDILLTPTTAQPPPPIGELVPTEENPFQGQLGSIPFAAFTSLFNSTGQPALSVPAGFSDGLPLGVQLVAAYGREDVLIAVGAQLETERRWSDTRSPLHP